MAVVVEVPDYWNGDTHVREPAGDLGNGAGSFIVVDGDTNQLTTGSCQLLDLQSGGWGVGCIRIRHRLNDDGMCRANGYAAYESGNGASTGYSGQKYACVWRDRKLIPWRERCTEMPRVVPFLDLFRSLDG